MEVSIEQLNADNYATWRDDMKVLLMKENCWRIVLKTEVAPTKSKDETAAKELRSFIQRADKAYGLIYLNIAKEYRSIISEIDNPVVAWELLEKQFRPDSRARVIGLTDEFFSCRINPGEEIGVYAARIRKIVNELKDAGRPIDDWYQAFQLIRFLAPEFNGIVQSVYRWKDEDFTFDKIKAELIAEESRLKQSIKDQESIAFSSSLKDVKGKSSEKPKAGNKQILRSRLPTKPPKPESCFITESCLSQDSDDTSWVLDTAASSHFCCNKNLLKDFKPIKNTSMVVAIGGVSCKVEGTGTVRMIFKNKGTPQCCYSIQQIVDLACKEAIVYGKCGVDGLIVENMFDVPYIGDKEIGPEITASMARVCTEVKKTIGKMPCGVQILSGNNVAATAVALAAGLQFVRVESFVFSHVADEGLMNACAGSLLRYARNIGARDILFLTDIKKKHCSHAITSDISVSQMAKAAEFFLSDAVILTGMETGDPPVAADLNDVKGTTKLPVLIGSGMTINNIKEYLTADGVIVGSHFKHDGHWTGHADSDRILKFMEKIQELQ